MVANSSERRTNLIDRHVGSRIRARRRALRMTQHTLASEIGLSVRELQCYERGLGPMEAEKVFKIAGALSTPPSSFLEGMPLAGAGRPTTALWLDYERMIATEEGEVLMGLFPKLTDPDKRRAVVEIVRVMVHGELSSALDGRCSQS